MTRMKNLTNLAELPLEICEVAEPLEGHHCAGNYKVNVSTCGVRSSTTETTPHLGVLEIRSCSLLGAEGVGGPLVGVLVGVGGALWLGWCVFAV